VERSPIVVAGASLRHRYEKVVAVIATALLLLSGCAPISPNAKYLFAPEVRTCPPTIYTESGQTQYYEDYSCWARIDEPRPAVATRGQGSSVTVSQATNYARQIEEEYTGAKSEYGSLSSAAGVLLIPAGASALALGAEGGAASAVSALGFGSAGLLGMGYWLSNPKREKVYMTGVDALECLIGVMQPFDVGQTSFRQLQDAVGDWSWGKAYPESFGMAASMGKEDFNAPRPSGRAPAAGMARANFQVESSAAYLGEELAALKTDPTVATDACLRPALCYAEQALKAAGTGTQAASKAYDAALKYQQYSERFAGNAMVSTTNTINNDVNKVMTDTEPNLQSLAGELSSVIPQSAQKLAGISSAASAAAAASAATQSVDFGTVRPGAPDTISKQGIVFGPSCKDPKHRIDATTAQALTNLFARSEELQWNNYQLNSATETVVTLTPTDITPKTDNCTKLFNQAGVPPDIISLNPGGYLVLKPGATQTIVVTGGKEPYDIRMMCDCYGNGISASIQYEGPKASIKVVASGGAKAGSYPFVIADSTGVGRPLTIVVDPAKKDDSDLPDCAPLTAEATVPKPGGSQGKAGTIVAASNAALAADQNATKAAGQANALDGKAEASNDGNKIVGYLNSATAAANNAGKYSKSAQIYAARVATMVAASGDPALKVYEDAAQSAANDALTQAQSAESAVKRIALHLSMVLGKPASG
jgi:hypothetical protein